MTEITQSQNENNFDYTKLHHLTSEEVQGLEGGSVLFTVAGIAVTAKLLAGVGIGTGGLGLGLWGALSGK